MVVVAVVVVVVVVQDNNLMVRGLRVLFNEHCWDKHFGMFEIYRRLSYWRFREVRYGYSKQDPRLLLTTCLRIYPLPHLPVVKDLVPDMTNFYRQV